VNKVIIKGRLTSDPELKRVGNDTAVTSFTVAVDRKFKDKDGNRQADFIPVTAWRQTAEMVGNYFGKGREILVEGSLQSRRYEDKDGNPRTAWDVVADAVYFCGSKSDGSSGGETRKPSNQVNTAPSYAMSDGELPF